MKAILRYFAIVMAGLVFFLQTGMITYAETEYVDDCMENPQDCEEPLENQPEQNTDENQLLTEDSESGSLFFEIVKLFFALLLVLALIYLFLYFLKRRNKLGTRIQALENLGGITVGQNKSVQLVRLGDYIYLIGVGEEITLLQKIEDSALIEEILKEKAEQAADFSASSLLTGFKQKKNEQNSEKNTNDFKKMFHRELSSLQQNRKNIIDKHKEDNNE
ncbi:flagellar biosynthetic protein FliO [Ralstonia pickettii]|nr:flagellar biosynthetic protein FliO [Ralstonia pickettii]